jgi:transcriptional regulator with XRE-family HTH domain
MTTIVRGEPRNVLGALQPLAVHREHAGMSREELAERAGVDLAEVVRVEEEDDEESSTPDVALLTRLFTAVRPPTPPGWDEGHEHDLTLTRAERGRSYRDGSRDGYWDFVDAYRDEVERPGWYRRARSTGPIPPVVVAEDPPARRYDPWSLPPREVTGDDPEDRQLRALTAVLDAHDVAYVVIGAQAARFHGWDGHTSDSDVTPALDAANLDRLGAALADLEARPETERLGRSIPEAITADWLDAYGSVTFATRIGRIDVVLRPAGVGDYERLVVRAVDGVLDGRRVRFADLIDVILSKRAAGREKDHDQLPELWRLYDRLLGREA